jgi:hypothetical protein
MAWTPSTGTDLYATIDEAVADDNDYDTSAATPTDDRMEVGITPADIPQAGTVTVRVRAAFV